MGLLATESQLGVDVGLVSNSAAMPGPPVDFEVFVTGVLPKVFRLAASLGVAGADSEDVAAEALARAFASWGRIGQLAYRDGWVLRTASNLICDLARRRARQHLADPLVVVGFEQRVVERAELVHALRRLSARQRQAVVLHHLAGLSVEETSEAMHASPNTVKKYLARGMAALRSHLGSPPEERSDG